MTELHEPTPEFRAFLEMEITSELRREARARSRQHDGRRHSRTVVIALVALAVGAIAGAVPAQVQDARQRETLTATARAEAAVADLRLQLARAAYEDARRKHDLGVTARASLAAAEAELRAAEASLAGVRLNLEEIRASALPPRNELSAPLVRSRDFVSERLRLEFESAQAELALAKDSVAELDRRVRMGLAEQLRLREAQTELARAEGELQVLAGRLDLRREFLARDLPAVEVERRQEQLELQQQVDVVRARQELAAARLKHLRDLRAVGQAEELDVKRAELEQLERAAELEAIVRRLQLLRGAGGGGRKE